MALEVRPLLRRDRRSRLVKGCGGAVVRGYGDRLRPAALGAPRSGTTYPPTLVMTSDHEARLITVVTFWRGTERVKHCNANTRWVNALLAPYIDRRLRMQMMVAQIPEAPMDETVSDTIAEREAETCFA